MNRSYLLAWVLLTPIIVATLGQNAVKSNSVGVKVGDWVKYNISFEGYVGWKTEDDRKQDWVKV